MAAGVFDSIAAALPLEGAALCEKIKGDVMFVRFFHTSRTPLTIITRDPYFMVFQLLWSLEYFCEYSFLNIQY